MAGDPLVAEPASRLMALGALKLRDRIASGALRSVELVEACIARIEAREDTVRAWAFFDSDFVREQARRLDAHRASGKAIGALHGVPVGIKDIVDTRRMPTENGCSLDAGRVPIRDAYIIDRLKQAGAVIMGKTATAELAYRSPPATRNPHNSEHTPGGSSSGSAAAVADCMVPLAVGTQTVGSVIRPASYCGVTGYKPSFGAIPRTGVLTQSPTLDTIGVFAADVTGAALLAQCLFGHDESDPATSPAATPRLVETACSKPPVIPTVAMVRPPGWEDADADLRDAFNELEKALGERAFAVTLPAPFAEARREHERINFAEMARHFHRYWRDGADRLSDATREAIEAGNSVSARDYLAALDRKPVLNAGLGEIFSRCDAIICPAATGPAPHGLDWTGNSTFNGLWTLCGTPAVTVPLMTATNGLPMGVQLIGAPGDDARLLRTTQWLCDWTEQ